MSDQASLPALRSNTQPAPLKPSLVHWWVDELSEMAGGHRREVIRQALIVYLMANTLHLASLKGRNTKLLGQVELSFLDGKFANDSIEARGLDALRRSRQPIVLRVGQDRGLVAYDELPAAAASELRSVLANRLDILTPWSEHQAYFDYRVVESTGGGLDRSRIRVEISVVPRSMVDPILEAFDAQGIDIAGLDVATDEAWAPPSINLLRDHRPKRLPVGFRLVAAAAVVAFIVGGGLIGHTIYRNAQTLEDQRRFADAVQTRVDERNAIAQDIEGRRNEAALIEEERGKYPSPLNVIERLSGLLPDEVWLEGLELDGRDLVLTGYAASASEVIPLLVATNGINDVEFMAPSTRAVMSESDGSSFEAEHFRIGALIAPEMGPTP